MSSWCSSRKKVRQAAYLMRMAPTPRNSRPSNELVVQCVLLLGTLAMSTNALCIALFNDGASSLASRGQRWWDNMPINEQAFNNPPLLSAFKLQVSIIYSSSVYLSN